MEYRSMSFTTTISSYSSVKSASLRTWCTSCRYPEVRYAQALARRAGVRSRPSREGSSPISFSSSRISSSMPSPRGGAAVFKSVVVGLDDHEAAQNSRGQRGLQPRPKGTGEIFAGGRHVAERVHRAREIVVVHSIQDDSRDRRIEGTEIRRHARDRIHLARHRHLDQVVVPVLPIALAVDALVLVGRQGGALEPVSRAEMVLTSEL